MQRMINLMFWKGMDNEIVQHVRSCHGCQMNKYKSYKLSGPFQAIIPRTVSELVAIDLFGPLVKSTFEYVYVFVLVDIFSKFVNLYTLRKATSTSCLNKIMNYMQEYGKPKSILSDNGSQFTSIRWRQKLRECNIKDKHTAVRYPCGNPCRKIYKDSRGMFKDIG